MEWSQIFSPFNITLAILITSSVFFILGKVRSDLIALCVLLALLLTGILEPAEALAGFSSSVVIMMAGLFIVGAGIFRTGLAKMISSKILQLGGKNGNLLFILVMLVTSLVGAFISNTGTVAVMMPIVISMASSAGINTRRYLMPMAFASGMGMFTLISNPPNLVIQDVLINAGMEPFSFFDFAPIGAIAVAVGITLLFFISKVLDKKDNNVQSSGNSARPLSELIEQYDLQRQIHKIHVKKGSPLIDKKVKELRIASIYNISIGKIIHRSTSKFRRKDITEIAGPETIIRKDDIIYCYGNDEDIERFVKENNLFYEKAEVSQDTKVFGDYGIAEAYIIPDSKLINKSVSESRIREKYKVSVLGIKRQNENEIIEIHSAKLHSGDSILVHGTWDRIAELAENQDDIVVIGQPKKEALKVTLDGKAPVAASIMLIMIIVMVLNIVATVTAVLAAAVLMIITGCLRNMEEAYNSINWNSIVLIGAMIPMATAFEKTGITEFISGSLLDMLGNSGPQVVLLVIYFCTSILTMFLSNTATAVLFSPIALQAAAGLGVSPYPMLLAVAVGANLCFASPYSTAPNALVMSAGNYVFKDYLRVGLPLQIIMGVILALVIPAFFPFYS